MVIQEREQINFFKPKQLKATKRKYISKKLFKQVKIYS